MALIAGALLGGSPARADDPSAEDKAYKALLEIVQVKPRDPKSDDCVVKGVADFTKYADQVPLFREAFLNREFSDDFYKQRRKQVFSFIVLKRAAELITEGMYNGKSQPECKFFLSVAYPDKFGQDRNFEAVTWRFNDAQSAKVNWSKFDARDFQDIALDYHVSPAVTTWAADEPSMNDKPAAPAESADTCDMVLFNANAIFIRATTFCKKDYMDSPEGLAALAGARKCSMSEKELKSKAGSAMLTLDKIARTRGKSAVCPFVEEVAHQIAARAE